MREIHFGKISKSIALDNQYSTLYWISQKLQKTFFANWSIYSEPSVDLLEIQPMSQPIDLTRKGRGTILNRWERIYFRELLRHFHKHPQSVAKILARYHVLNTNKDSTYSPLMFIV